MEHIIRSKAHEYTGDFKPQEGSPAYERGEHRKRETLAEFIERTDGFMPQFDVQSFRDGEWTGESKMAHHRTYGVHWTNEF